MADTCRITTPLITTPLANQVLPFNLLSDTFSRTNQAHQIHEDDHLWLQHPLCAACAVQADALIHTIIGGKIVAHLVAVATAFILCSAVSAALGLRGLLQSRQFEKQHQS